MNRPTSAGGLFVFGTLVVIAAILVLVLSGNRAGGSRSGAASAASVGGRSPSAAGRVAPLPAPRSTDAVGERSAAARRRPTGAIQANVETLDPALRRAHDRLLRERPLFQHLPYRDTEIGVDVDRVAAGGRLELLVTYLGTRSRAIRDVRRLLARYGDPGTAYVERFQRVF